MSESTAEQLRTLTDRIDALNETSVSRKEFEELKLRVLELANRLEAIAPAGQVSDEHLAIMSAVFAASIGKRFKIKKVQHVAEPGGWTQAGRTNLHAQRNTRNF